MVSIGTKASKPCPLCGEDKSIIFFEMHNIPCNCNLLWQTREEAINCPKGDLTLGYCPSCTFIANYTLQPEKNQYIGQYDNSLYHSHLFQYFAKNKVQSLIDKYNLHGKTVMEATVGKVDFLSFFCSLGSNKGIKFDTSFINSLEGSKKDIIPVDYNSLTEDSDSGRANNEPVDFVFSYHELEHANSPRHFLNILKERIGKNSETIFYISVPHIIKAFHEGDFTDVIYEHPSYFTSSALLLLFTSCGYNIIDIREETGVFSSSLSVVASLNKDLFPKFDKNHELEPIEKATSEFGIKTKMLMTNATRNIKHLLDQGKRIVMWGAGARGVTLLNIFKDDRIKYVIDINPSKQGKFLPGTAQKIMAPDFLVTYKPDYVFIANSVYKEEIAKLLRDLNVKSELLTLTD
ncbi:MAG: class I SAM-dependent methyltransferase [Candidatus Bathyarchaeota archaeon]|nr:class I SAM-dependent methyltransferase [Candidatus Bathyarchaeota archaeon]